MTKKVRHWRGKSRTTASVIKTVNKDTFASAICPTNLEDQKQKFLTLGKTPELQYRGTEDELEEIYSKPRSEIRFDLLGEALHILKMVKEKYGDAENYYTEMYGDRITKEEATDIIVDYLKENHLDGQMSIIWCTDLPCSGRMMWQGPHVKYRRPEARKYSMWIKDAKDNNFLRECGIRCLSDHEIGTHFFRSYNDGLQPWFAERTKFGIRGTSCLEQLRTEEGLAAVNTILNAKCRYLWGPALLYYIACKATEMTFKQLFEHLEKYVENPEWRWRHCVRVKRGLLNPNDIGGYGKDQCYFEGAVDILRNVDTIDFKVLMSGKICFDEIQRVKKLARLNCIQVPAFMRNQEKYKKQLKQIAHMNGLHLEHAKYKAPTAYVRRLKKGRRIGVAQGSKKVRKNERKSSVSSLGMGHDGGDCSNGGLESNKSDYEDESFFFQEFKNEIGSVVIDDGFYERMKKKMDTEELAKDTSPTGSVKYYETVVKDKVKLKSESAVEQKSAEKSHNTLSKHVDRDWEHDCYQPAYRCVSRASVQSMLSLPSNSLNSRNKNSNAEGSVSSTISLHSLRPLSNSSIRRTSSNSSCDGSQQQQQQKSEESIDDLKRSRYSVVSKALPPATPLWSPSTCTVQYSSTNQALPGQSSPSMNQAQPHSNSVRKEADGFIYPENDILTDDMIKIKTGSQSAQMEGQQTSQNAGPSQVKLLHRRVKSAANLLPNFTA
ncbi:hypothetical protein ACF0H5_007264 [Mactra antiquata]